MGRRPVLVEERSSAAKERKREREKEREREREGGKLRDKMAA